MRIGIDGRLWTESGVGRYIRNLVFNLGELDKKNNYFIFLLKKDIRQKFPKNFIKVEANFSWYGLTEQVKLPKLLKTYQLDLIHFPHFSVPILYKGRFIVTIHDLIHQHFQMRRATTLDPITYKIKQFGYKTILNSALKKSSHILVPSSFVKGQLVSELSILADKVSVTHEGVEEQLIAQAAQYTQDKINRVLNKLGIKPPFIFYVGNAHPHKNVEGLIKAFLNLRKKFRYLQLVLSGYDHYFWERIKKEYKHNDVIYTGYVTDEELVALYKSAQLLVMPSFEEGFGIPLLEAMACSCPVVSSNAGSLPEIGADAAIYFDPHNIEDITQRITQVLNSDKLRRELIEKGSKRYKHFSWQKLATQTLEAYYGTNN